MGVEEFHPISGEKGRYRVFQRPDIHYLVGFSATSAPMLTEVYILNALFKNWAEMFIFEQVFALF